MTTVTVGWDETGISGLTVAGHAGFAQSGQDIVCAAVSVLITTCANALESVAGISPVVSQEESAARISVFLPAGLKELKRREGQIILQTVLRGFSDIAGEYPKNLQINDGRTSSC